MEEIAKEEDAVASESASANVIESAVAMRLRARFVRPALPPW